MENKDLIQAFKEELKECIKSGIVKDPALFWAGKMSTYTRMMLNTSLMFIGITDISNLVFLLIEEYDKEIFGGVCK